MLLLIANIFLAIGDLFRSEASLHAEVIRLRHENLVLRRQAPKRLHLNNSDRWFLVWLHWLWPKHARLSLLVTPATLLRWHRQGFRSYWRWKSRALPGRSKIDRKTIALIKRIAKENVLWGAPRIHGELLKLDITIAESTVAKYMPRIRSRGGSPSWRTFLSSQIDGIAAIDLFTVPTINYQELYAVVVVGLNRRNLVLLTATNHPTAMWLAQQINEAFPWNTAPRFLIRDNNAKFGHVFTGRLKAYGIRDRPIAPRSPWQNGYAERVIGTIRRECLDHVIVWNETHLRALLSEFADYYNAHRTHLALEKDAPDTRPVHHVGKIVHLPVLGGLHHRYERCAEAQESNIR
jgi:transposase InsO family protein